MNKREAKDLGQATIEYLFVIIFVMFLGVQFFQYLGLFVGNSVGGLGYQLTNHLATGVCPSNCFFDGFVNRVW